MKAESRNYWLDTLRGISCIAVVIFHLNEPIPFQNNIYQSVAKYGWLGVPVFFIVSGYCIQLAASRSTSALNFIVKRFLRIYPPYIFSIFLVLCVGVFRKFATGINDVAVLPHSLQAWLITLSLMTKPASSIPTMNWVYWTLTYEVVFYLIVAFSLMNKQLKIPILFTFAFLSMIPSSEHYFFALSQFSFFSLGISLYELNYGKRTEAIALLLLSATGIAIKQPILTVAVAFFSCLSILLSFSNSGIKLSQKNWFSRAGETSYSLYLSHVPVGCFLLIQFRTGLWVKILPLHIFYDLMTLIVCLFVAKILYNLVEKPSMLLAKRYK